MLLWEITLQLSASVSDSRRHISFLQAQMYMRLTSNSSCFLKQLKRRIGTTLYPRHCYRGLQFIPGLLPWRERRDELAFFGPSDDGRGRALHFTGESHLFPSKGSDLHRLIMGQASLISKHSGPY